MNGVSLLKCICDETRFEILELLQKDKELCVNDFVEKLKKELEETIESTKLEPSDEDFQRFEEGVSDPTDLINFEQIEIEE